MELRTKIRSGSSHALACLLLVGSAGLPAVSVEGQEVDEPSAPYTVSPVSGPSLLTKLRAGVDHTALGRIGMIGHIPAEVKQQFENPDPTPEVPGWWYENGFSLSGADLYRLNCRSCHGASAEGLGPLIPALGEPVKAASPTYVQERMEQRGRSIPDELAQRLASRAELSLRHRLLKGGIVMPPFGHLKGEEVDALLEFLGTIAGVSEEQAHLRVNQPANRVGEHIIKSTCLICHDATGGMYRSNAADQVIPSMDRFTHDYPVQQFVRKVQTGSPLQADPRGRMPTFRYLSDEELKAAYLYIMAYPPEKEQN